MQSERLLLSEAVSIWTTKYYPNELESSKVFLYQQLVFNINEWTNWLI